MKLALTITGSYFLEETQLSSIHLNQKIINSSSHVFFYL